MKKFSLCLLLFCCFQLNGINFDGKNSLIVLGDENSGFKIKKSDSVDGWKQTSIIKSLPENNLFLTDNQEWTTSSTYLWVAPQESFNLINDLTIPDNEVVVLSTDSIIDGQGNSIILGRHSQLLIDGGVTVTFKNLKIINSFNTISKPIIRCMDWYSKLCLDNVKLALNDDFVFRNGQLFIHNDVEITGTSKFSYQSVRPSYIIENSNLIFSPEATFEYYPSTTDNSLIKMQDETSKLFFDGSTLQSTHTGIRLTKGSVYFDNKVTLTNGIDNRFSTAISTTNYNYGTKVWSVEFSPDDKYIAVGGQYPKSGQELQVFSLNGEALQLIATQDYGIIIMSTRWSPDGKYLAVGGYIPSSGDELQVYAFNGTSLTLIDSANYGAMIYSVEWSPDGKYLAIGGNNPVSPVAEEIQIYSFDGTKLTFISSADSDRVYSVDWHPSGKYLAVAGYASNEIAVYAVSDGVISGLVCEVDYGSTSAEKVKWSKDGIYLACSGEFSHTGNELHIYIFSGSSLHLLDSRDYGPSSSDIWGLEWSPDSNYILLGGFAPSNPNNHEIQIYSFKNMALSTNPIFTHDYGDQASTAIVYSVDWSNSGCYIIWGGEAPYSGNEMEVFKIDYRFDTTPQLYSDGIIFGDSSLGSDYDLNTYLNSGARVGLYGKLWEDSLNTINFANKNSFIALSDESSKFKITNAESLNGWRETAIIKSLPDNSLFLTDNQEWGTTSGERIPPQESFELMNDLTIPDNKVVVLSTDSIIDGQGNSIILGRHSQLLIDAGITITFKNLKIKNNFNTISKPPIRCMGWYSKLCLENVELALSDDFTFRNGQFFIHNDVEITGTSKFSYRSVRPSYIAENSNLIFSPQTTFEYYPSTTNNSLIKMQDKSSKLFFDGSTLQSTHTGIRLTKGSLYFENNVTLSTVATTSLNSLEVADTLDWGTVKTVDWRNDKEYLALVKSYNDLLVYNYNGNSLNLVASLLYDSGTIFSVKWSPDGKYLAVGGYKMGNENYVVSIYSFDGAAFTLLDFIKESGSHDWTESIDWSPDGRYLAIGGAKDLEELRIYEWNGSTLQDLGSGAKLDFEFQVDSVNWHPSGKYLAISGERWPSVYSVVVYGWNGVSLQDLGAGAKSSYFGDLSHVYAVSWSPDGLYLAAGGAGEKIKVYGWSGFTLQDLGSGSEIDWGSDEIFTLGWDPSGRYLAIGGQNRLFIYDWVDFTLKHIASVPDNWDAIFSIDWSSDGKSLLAGGQRTGDALIIYEVNYNMEESVQPYSNGIVFGDSSLGSDYDLNIHLNSGARVELYGKLWEDSFDDGINFANKNSFIVLSDDSSKFKITNAESLNGWRETAIIKSLPNNSLFLTDNQEWGTTSGEWIPPQESFELISDLVINDGQQVLLSTSVAIDGNGNSLLFGHNSSLLIDSGVTVTLKNLNLQNISFEKISSHPFQVKTNDSAIVLDNVSLNLNGNISFTKGSLFVHNDVKITGSTEFIYSSPDSSFIEPNSRLYFRPGTSLYYNQDGVSTNMNLLVMQDETSELFLDGATLRTTDTGIRLTKGKLYLDNKITLSGYTKIPQTYSNGIIFGNSSLGSEYNLDICVLAASRVEIFGKVFYDDI